MPCVPDLLVFAGGDCRVPAAAYRVSYRPARIFGMADNYSVVAHPVGCVRDLEEIIKVGFSGYASNLVHLSQNKKERLKGNTIKLRN